MEGCGWRGGRTVEREVHFVRKSTVAASLIILCQVPTEPGEPLCVTSLEIITGSGRRAKAHVDEAKDESWGLWKHFSDYSFVCLFIQQLLTECTFCVIVGGADGIHVYARWVPIQWITATCEQRIFISVSCEPYTWCSKWSKKRERFWDVWESFPGEVVFELALSTGLPRWRWW